MHYEWNTFASNWNHGGISCDVHFAGHLRSNRTNVLSDKNNIRNVQSGGARGLELRTAAVNHDTVIFSETSIIPSKSHTVTTLGVARQLSGLVKTRSDSVCSITKSVLHP